MIKNLIFDFGNVMVNYNPLADTMRYVSDPEEAKRICHEVFDSDEWKSGDRGERLKDEITELLVKKHPADEKVIRILMEKRAEFLTAPEGTGKLVHELKDAGFHLFYLTNTAVDSFEYMYNTHEYYKCFEGGVRSYEDKLLKPDHAIYKLVLSRYGLKAEESVFVDDMPVNTKAAAECGLHTVTLPEPTLLRKCLRVFPEIAEKIGE